MNEERKLYEDWLHKSPEFEETIISAWDVWQARAALSAPSLTTSQPAVVNQLDNPQPEPAAPAELAPGYCKHCRQYTIEEPLPPAPNVKTEADAFCDLHCTWLDHAPGCVRAEPVAFAYYWPPTNTLRRNPAYQLDCSPMTVWKDEIPLFTSPPRTALTQDRIVDLAASYQLDFGRWSFINVLELESFARAVIEAAHGITERKP